MSRVAGRQLLMSGALVSAVAAGCGGVTEPYQEELSRLRSATQEFTAVSAALAAGYTVQLTGCMSDPALGGMGFHIGNPERTNGTVDLAKPEVLLYEPTADGARVLVAVEYIVPFTAWTAANPPALMGQSFRRNEEFGVWALHVWLYRENPTGIFSEWNPRVSCTPAAPATGMGA
jgi:hypothetical protein